MIIFRYKSPSLSSLICFVACLVCFLNFAISLQTTDNNKLTATDNDNSYPQNLQKQCDGNRFQYISSYVLTRHQDLNLTFTQIQNNIAKNHLKNITYSDKVGRYYKIYNFVPSMLYLQSKQVPQIRSLNVLNISGASLRINYTFEWQKQQLGVTSLGNGTGLVTTDPITFQKILETNQSHKLQWVFSKAYPVKISNSLTLTTISPFKQADYIIINQMLNDLKTNATTVKKQLIHDLNVNFTSTLSKIILTDNTTRVDENLTYNYADYRGQFSVFYDNMLLDNWLSKTGLSLLYSQTINNYSKFQCGQRVPDRPQDQSVYGGTQEYISHKYVKSTLKYSLMQHFLDVTLTQDNWQSRAFQFYLGDFHDTIASVKNITSFKPLNGKCQALDDDYFNLTKKSLSSYSVFINFTCYIMQNTTKVVDIILPVEYQVVPTLTNRQINFVVKNLKTTPKFIQNPKYKITNMDLAVFMLTQTLNTAAKSKVIGSGFKTRNRKTPRIQVRDQYLFLYDKSTVMQEVDLRQWQEL